VDDFAIGDRVKAGDLLGSIFDHMDAKVLADFAAVGATPTNTIISKAHRDVAPCNFSAGGGRPGQDWVTLRR